MSTYSSVASNPYVDGVFVPDGGVNGTTAIAVSSTEFATTGVRNTGNTRWDYILNDHPSTHRCGSAGGDYGASFGFTSHMK